MHDANGEKKIYYTVKWVHKPYQATRVSSGKASFLEHKIEHNLSERVNISPT